MGLLKEWLPWNQAEEFQSNYLKITQLILNIAKYNNEVKILECMKYEFYIKG